MRLAVINSTGGGISGGYRNYLSNMLPRLAADPGVESLLCVSPASLRVQEWMPHNIKIQFTDCPPYRLFRRNLGQELKRILASFKPDVIFVPAARPISFQNVPVVTMIQNMSPLVSWKWYGLTEKPRLAAQWFETYRAVRQADRVIAISDFVRQFLIKSWAINPVKVVPVYFGVPQPADKQIRPKQIPQEWGTFVFTAGSIEPYRALEDIIKCAAHSRKDLGMPLQVVIAGSARKSMQTYALKLQNMAQNAGIRADLCWTGQLSNEEMAWCYKNCSAFIMTSRVEAAPSTVLEAMACGAVCIAADNSPLPEFFGRAALYYRPGDGAMLADRIKEVFSWDSSKRTEVAKAAHERVGEFNWGNSAKKTLQLFENVLRRR